MVADADQVPAMTRLIEAARQQQKAQAEHDARMGRRS